ncbi:unnamed protein product [Bursaphelenchus okinawaensis]|uniref:Peptidase S72 domain-containing protein n=1 Tax=Bursaphelenchus okinawaensis TaxID=465554 RepID=A0A811JV83_9BILA|nr:unnamed protein product [Bursaphelenchus okinawaensis]CAG9083977.1 unnamed protein product [Bursaphelenchus okinawaensis]
MRILLLAALLPLISAVNIECLNNKTQWLTTDLPKNLALPANYSAVVTFVARNTNTSIRFTERAVNGVRHIERTQKGQDVQHYIIKDNVTTLFTKSKCSRGNLDVAKDIYPFPAVFADVFKNLTNIQDIVSSILGTPYNNQKDTAVVQVDGFPAVKWLGCVNRTDKRDAVEIRVNFVGEDTVQPPFDVENSWPQALNIQFISYNYSVVNDTVNPEVKEDLTVSILVLKKIDNSEIKSMLKTPDGVFCENTTPAKLPAGLPPKFEADLTYVDVENKLINTAELMYDEDNRILAFGLDFNADSDIPYVQNSNTTTSKSLGKAKIFLDFKSGFEYVLSKDGRACKAVNAIEKEWASVEEKDGKIGLKKPNDVFFNQDEKDVYKDEDVIQEGVTYDKYVVKKYNNDTKENITAEYLFYNKDFKLEGGSVNLIYSIKQYHQNEKNETKTSIIYFNQIRNNTLIGTSWSKHTVFPCLADGKSDNFFYLKLVNKSLPDLQKIGYENVESALAEAISKTANISVLRISQFLLKQLNTQLMAGFLLGEKNPMDPANTTDLIVEKNVTEVRNLLNGTLQTQQINVNIVTDDHKTQTVSVNGFGVLSTADDHPFPPPSYNGYTGGSMFILGLFAFIFGVGIAVGSYVFYTKRQGIRGIAYQVFE